MILALKWPVLRDENTHRGVGWSTRRFLAEDNRSNYFEEKNKVRREEEGREEYHTEERGAKERKRRRRSGDTH
jgi:hypothetical protein